MAPWLKDRLSPRRQSATSTPPAATTTATQQDPDVPTPENRTLFQAFEWHTPSTPPHPHETHSPSSHYHRLVRLLPTFLDLGLTSLWLPPGCKANNPRGNGYDCYDLWDLGEFDQKWARSTRWGSREELSELLAQARGAGVECVWDAVLNHKTAGDGTEECWAVEVDAEDRRVETGAPARIEAWLRYDFPGREREGMPYSRMKWRAEHFNGTDWDQKAQRNAIFKLISDPATAPKPPPQAINGAASGMSRLANLAGRLNRRLSDLNGAPPKKRPGKGWADDVDDLHGNFDYLMFSNIDYTHPEVREDALRWGQWMVEDTGVQGFRLDAVQHFSYAFTKEWVAMVQEAGRSKHGGKEPFIVGEIWTGEVARITRWMDAVGLGVFAYDSPLLYNFSRISEDVRRGSPNADLRTVLRDSLVDSRPGNAVTLVTNHDTQPGQTSFTPIDAGLKSLFYAFILLRAQGYPCVFWGDLYGTQGPHSEPPSCLVPDGRGGTRSLLPDLLLVRRLFAYGEQKDYFDAMSCIGWTRAGTHDKPGCAVVMSIGGPPPSKTTPKRKSQAGPVQEEKGSKRSKEVYTQKKMAIGKPGETWVDILGNTGARAEVTIDAKGSGAFPCKGKGVGVFVRKEWVVPTTFPVEIDRNILGL